jgi:hypothetical protein
MWRRIVWLIWGVALILVLAPYTTNAYSLTVTISGYGTISDNGPDDSNPLLGVITFDKTFTDFKASGTAILSSSLTSLGVTLTSAYIEAINPGDVSIAFGLQSIEPLIDPPFWVEAFLSGYYYNSSGTIGSAQVTFQPILLGEYNEWVPAIDVPAVNNVASMASFSDSYVFYNMTYSMDKLVGGLSVTLGSAGDGIYLPDSGGVSVNAPIPASFLLVITGLLGLGGFSIGRRKV